MDRRPPAVGPPPGPPVFYPIAYDYLPEGDPKWQRITLAYQEDHEALRDADERFPVPEVDRMDLLFNEDVVGLPDPQEGLRRSHPPTRYWLLG